MKKISINLDEAIELDIYAKVGRTFHCQIDHDRPIIGNLTFTARSDFGITITLNQSDGITVDNSRITLFQTYTQMQMAPNGVYQYDLVEVSGNRADNLYSGKLILQPSPTIL